MSSFGLKNRNTSIYFHFALSLVLFLLLIAFYAPFFSSDYPILEWNNQKVCSPFFLSLFSKKVYPSEVDRLMNFLMLTLPICLVFLKKYRRLLFLGFCFFGGAILFSFLISHRTTLSLNQGTIYTYWPFKNFEKAFSYVGPTRLTGQLFYPSLLFALRSSCFFAVLSTLLAYSIGSLWGLISAFSKPKIDAFLSRLLEIGDSIPTLFLVMILLSHERGNFILYKAFVFSLLSFSSIARWVRLETLRQKKMPYVEMLFSFRVKRFTILKDHLLPNCYWILISLGPYFLAQVLLIESALSFFTLTGEKGISLGQLIEESYWIYPFSIELFFPLILILVTLIGALIYISDVLKAKYLPFLNKNPLQDVKRDDREKSTRGDRDHPSANDIFENAQVQSANSSS